jgi:hypothetical protein
MSQAIIKQTAAQEGAQEAAEAEAEAAVKKNEEREKRTGSISVL